MPYIPDGASIFSIPNWEKKHPELHPRWISMKPEKFRGHTWDFGTGAYVPYGSQFETIEQLREAARGLGLPDSAVNSTLQRVVIGDLMLAYISKDEAARRMHERAVAAAERDNAALEAHLAKEQRGITPRVFESEAEYLDERKSRTRDSNNRVGYTGRAAR